MSEKRLVVGYASQKGVKREKNEDRYFVDISRGLFIVADGMGGHNAGEIASKIAIGTISRVLTASKINEAKGDSILDLIKASIDEANDTIYDLASKNPGLYGMGTTVVVALIRDSSLYLAHIGDTRTYLIRDNTIKRLTQDHSVVAELIELGEIGPEEARSHPMRHIVTRALGTKPQDKADMREIEIRSDDHIVLCTDGLHELFSDADILNIILSQRNPMKASKELMARVNKLQGADDATIVIIHLEPIGM